MGAAAGSGIVRVVVRKADRLLEIWRGDVMLASMRMCLGTEPAGHKQRSADGRTPEGIYRVCSRNAKSKFHLSLGLDYPNRADADTGLSGGLITHEQHCAIVKASETGKRPPWDTPLGGEIMIHGGGTGADWTAGCIALDDACMDKVWEMVPIGAEVQIVP